jgi:hypothetical protein
MENRCVVEIIFLIRERYEVSSRRHKHGVALTVRTNFTVVALGPVPRTGWSRMLSYDVLRVYYPRSNVELS